MSSRLTAIPNVGPAVARKLERLCALEGHRLDPCLLDTFVAAVDYAGDAPARPWWEYSRERKARVHA